MEGTSEIKFVNLQAAEINSEEIKIEYPYLNEPFDPDFEEEIDSSGSRQSFHFLFRTAQSHQQFIKKYPEEKNDGEFSKIWENQDYLNEFFESNLLKAAIAKGILDKDKIIIPSIKLDPESDDVYYSEYISDTISATIIEVESIAILNGLSYKDADQMEDLFVSKYYDKAFALWRKFLKDLRKEEIAAPLSLLHAVAGDFDRAANNYRFKIIKDENGEVDFKIVVLDMAGGWGEYRGIKGFIKSILLRDLDKETVMKYWPRVKEFIEKDDLVNKILEKAPLSKELKGKKREEILGNINNMEILIDKEFEESEKK